MRLGYDVAVTHAFTEELRAQAKHKFVTEYHAAMAPFYARCSAKDQTVFTENLNISFLNHLKLREKWLDNAISDETRETIWTYVLELNRCSQLYCSLLNKIPTNALSQIQNTAMNLAEQIKNGEMSLQNLDLQQLGQSVVDQMDQDDVQNFTNDLMQDPAALQQLCSSMLGGNAGGNANLATQAMMMLASQAGSKTE
jgi:hypothetical protein